MNKFISIYNYLSIFIPFLYYINGAIYVLEDSGSNYFIIIIIITII